MQRHAEVSHTAVLSSSEHEHDIPGAYACTSIAHVLVLDRGEPLIRDDGTGVFGSLPGGVLDASCPHCRFSLRPAFGDSSRGL
jgi:hypothetical protein